MLVSAEDSVSRLDDPWLKDVVSEVVCLRKSAGASQAFGKGAESVRTFKRKVGLSQTKLAVTL